MTAARQEHCLVCAGRVAPLLDLDVQPLANMLLAGPAEPFQAYPLGLAVCHGCSHAQLTHFLQILRGIMLKGVGIEVLWAAVIPLALFGVGVFALSANRFNKRLG